MLVEEEEGGEDEDGDGDDVHEVFEDKNDLNEKDVPFVQEVDPSEFDEKSVSPARWDSLDSTDNLT